MQNDSPMRIGAKRAIITQGLVVEVTGKRKNAAIAKYAQAPAHDIGLEARRLQLGQWQTRGPKEATHQKCIRGHGLAANSEQRTNEEDGEWEKSQPWNRPATIQAHANRNAGTYQTSNG